MAQWQFLIQKEGDQDWLPLESFNVEILEGRYQLAAQVATPATAVDIQIRHEYDLDGILQEVTQRRRQQTDGLGRLELLPLTFFSPGLWEFKCQPAADSDSIPGALSSKLVLQVLAQDFDLLIDWEPLEFSPTPTRETVLTSSVACKDTVRQGTAPVSLPSIPKEIPEISLQVATEFRLPPQIYCPDEFQLSHPSSTQLPEFLPMSVGLHQALSEQVPSTYLEFLRRVARSADRHAVQTAFEALMRRQRFWETLNALAQVSAPLELTQN
jgi:hypothetical protein